MAPSPMESSNISRCACPPGRILGSPPFTIPTRPSQNQWHAAGLCEKTIESTWDTTWSCCHPRNTGSRRRRDIVRGASVVTLNQQNCRAFPRWLVPVQEVEAPAVVGVWYDPTRSRFKFRVRCSLKTRWRESLTDCALSPFRCHAIQPSAGIRRRDPSVSKLLLTLRTVP